MHATFLCIGQNLEPEVHALCPAIFDTFNERLRIASMRDSDKARLHAHRVTFGKAFDYAIPCWSVDAMSTIALEYVGAHQARVRFLAAAIALGETYGADEGEHSDDTGGTKVKASPKPTKPTKPRPGSSVFDLLSIAS